MESPVGLGMHGRLTVATFDEYGRLVEQSGADNLIVTTGLSLLASAVNYSMVLSENVSWGSPYSPPVGALYGAVGTSTTAPAAGQTALVAEIGRALVSTAAVTSNQLTYDFFFPTSSGNGTINEVGTFGNASLMEPVLTAQLTSGSVYTTLSVTGVTTTIPASSTLTIGYTSGTTQQVTTSGSTSPGATTINVSSFTASATFPVGTIVAYTPGTLIDRAVLGVPVTKTSSQTMILELSLTLTSA